MIARKISSIIMFALVIVLMSCVPSDHATSKNAKMGMVRGVNIQEISKPEDTDAELKIYAMERILGASGSGHCTGGGEDISKVKKKGPLSGREGILRRYVDFKKDRNIETDESKGLDYSETISLAIQLETNDVTLEWDLGTGVEKLAGVKLLEEEERYYLLKEKGNYYLGRLPTKMGWFLDKEK